LIRSFQFLVAVLSWPLVRLVFRLRTKGLENVPRNGGLVIGSNHLSNLDPWAVCLPLWPRRRFRFMGKSELFNPLVGPIVRIGGAFPVHRGEGDRAAIETAVQVVRGGDVLTMFPEGTRRVKGLRKKFQPRAHTGTARIALAAEAPLVPAAVAGTDRLSRLGPVRVAYGPPLQLDDLAEREPREAARIATDRLMIAIGELEEQL
jgi:1-acyl-sn-glycerol-3-phosphate acyltransferase